MSEFQSISLALFLTVAWAVWAARVAYVQRRKKSGKLADLSSESSLIAFASQTGTAELLAKKLAAQQDCAAVAFDQLTLEHMSALENITFVVSTYGDGEPPDNGRKLFKQLGRSSVHFPRLKFSVVALGDKTYPDFCAFGYALQQRMLQAGATEFKSIELHDRITAEEIGTANHVKPVSLRLIRQQRLNKGPSDGLFELEFEVLDKTAVWQAGDLVDFKLPNAYQDPHMRTYSIASVPEEGVLKLIVRQYKQENGEFGVCSKWLTFTLTEGDVVDGYIRENKVCHLEDMHSPILKIATGSGLAGVRSQVMQRKQNGEHGPIWLIYGERYPEQDEPLADELQQWLEEGTLKQLDKVFSRQSISQSETAPRYVQDKIAEQAQEIQKFIQQNGHIYVCGRHHSMGVEVDLALQKLFGEAEYERLVDEHRYHRDTY
ncbi:MULTISPECIES: NADPH cytochrome P450 oxidoreductase family protein [Gammaproteobacteria]|uniref:NADPH cytochrome P450 oxidoreductase family protein n=1 Tax=Gammaproteobacteria TaxID=1236 RepID=UPI000DD06F63|nr:MULTISPECIES: NADPH cytochrome P450 oxidoreductase family protein [Gammaproteobacteria]RTE85933.1 hypothetical protein DQX04_10850 [Aliidiomarina sp. B3213]TCZ90068.1 hypothetical protein EYQ95_09615 [Lysobacter sp. N42]